MWDVETVEMERGPGLDRYWRRMKMWERDVDLHRENQGETKGKGRQTAAKISKRLCMFADTAASLHRLEMNNLYRPLGAAVQIPLAHLRCLTLETTLYCSQSVLVECFSCLLLNLPWLFTFLFSEFQAGDRLPVTLFAVCSSLGVQSKEEACNCALSEVLSRCVWFEYRLCQTVRSIRIFLHHFTPIFAIFQLWPQLNH